MTVGGISNPLRYQITPILHISCFCYRSALLFICVVDSPPTIYGFFNDGYTPSVTQLLRPRSRVCYIRDCNFFFVSYVVQACPRLAFSVDSNHQTIPEPLVLRRIPFMTFRRANPSHAPRGSDERYAPAPVFSRIIRLTKV